MTYLLFNIKNNICNLYTISLKKNTITHILFNIENNVCKLYTI